MRVAFAGTPASPVNICDLAQKECHLEGDKLLSYLAALAESRLAEDKRARLALHVFAHDAPGARTDAQLDAAVTRVRKELHARGIPARRIGAVCRHTEPRASFSKKTAVQRCEDRSAIGFAAPADETASDAGSVEKARRSCQAKAKACADRPDAAACIGGFRDAPVSVSIVVK
jgi:hypothetical protein